MGRLGLKVDRCSRPLACFVELILCSRPWACFVELIRCSRPWACFVEFGRSWGGLGAILGRSWSLLGRSWGDLGPSWVGLERSWAVLGRSWGGLGAVLGGLGAIFGWSWGGLGRSDRNRFGQQIDQKSDQNLRWSPEAILNRFWVVWGSMLDGFGVDLDGFGIDLGRFSNFFGGRVLMRRGVPQVSLKLFPRCKKSLTEDP